MADKMTTSNTYNLTINFARNNNAESRVISIEAYSVTDPKSEITTFRNLLLGKFNKFLQPNGWRDSDLAEEEWTITDVKVKFISKRETEFDFPS